jgi:hypothetical protein
MNLFSKNTFDTALIKKMRSPEASKESLLNMTFIFTNCCRVPRVAVH